MKRLIVFFIFFLSVACGSRKVQIRSVVAEETLCSSQLEVLLFRNTELLKLLDIKICKIEERDSSGNEKIITNTNINLKEKINEQDTVKVKSNIDEKRNLDQSINIDDNRKGVIISWVWIIGFVTTIVLVILVYSVKR